MAYTLTKRVNLFHVEKFGIALDVYPDLGSVGLVIAETETGHNQEFRHTSTFHYLILEGGGTFFLDDEEVSVEKGDMLSIPPHTRIYYKGRMKILLVTDPPWKEENEVETRAKIW